MDGPRLTGFGAGWLATGLVGVTALLLWLHLRQPRRHRLLVSFEALWAGLPGVTTRQGLRGRLRRIVALLLQLAAAWALLVAAAEPKRVIRAQRGQAVAILIDCSASMATLDAQTGQRRMDAARERAQAVIDGLGPDDQAVVIGFARTPLPRTGLTGDRPRLRRAVAELEVQEWGAVLAPALGHARDLIAGQPRGRLVIVSDTTALASEAPGVELLPVGRPADNVAIVGFTGQRAGGRGELRAEVTLRLFGRQSQRVAVALHAAGSSRALTTLEVELGAGQRRTVATTVAAPGAGALEARLLRPAVGAGNALDLDDRAFTALPQARPRRVLTVGPRNLYLEGALLGLGAAVTTARAQGLPAPADLAGFDAVIFDGVTPPAPPEAGRFLFLDPAGAGSPFPARGQVRDPVATEVRRNHPLLAHVSLADLNVAQARRLLPAPDDQVVVSALGTPLLIARERPGLRLAALAFDPRQSDLPLRPAFPLLLANAIDWLTGGRSEHPGGSAAPGTRVVLDGQSLVAPARAGVRWLPPPTPGGERRAIAASFVDERESDTTATGSAGTPAPDHRPATRSPWRASTWLLALAALLAAAEWLMAGAASGRRRTRARLVRAMFLTAVAGALAALTVTLPARPVPPDVALLADGSTSVADAGVRRAAAVWSALQRPDAPDGPRGWRFAEGVLPLPDTAGPAATVRVPGPPGTRTDLALALAAGLASLDPDRPGRLLLASDGIATQGQLGPPLVEARARGVEVSVLPVERRPPPALAITAWRAVGALEPGAAFVLEAELYAPRPVEARLALSRDGAALAEAPDRTVQLSGTGTARFTVPVPEERAVYRLQAAAPSPSSPEDAWLAVAGVRPPRVLIVAEARAAGVPLERALAAERIEVHVVTSRGLGDGAALADHELVVLADVPPARLGPALGQALRDFVQQRGGGLLVAGAASGWGGGGYERTLLAPLLPLEHDPGERKEEPTLALALVIDRSGSMSGPKMELTKQAARGAAQLLKPADLISVVAFDSQAQIAVRLQPAANRQRVAAGIAAIRSGGGTNILPGLREALDQLMHASARRKHVILLSDGQSPADGVIELVDEAASAHITVSAVGVGDAADLTLLQQIAHRGGGRFHHARDPSTVPRIFTRETAELTAAPVREAPVRARLVKPTQALANISFATAPALRGHARARVRSGAEVLLATPEGDPLLARWQSGLGQVLIWTSDLGGHWAAPWTRWREFPRLWGQLARSAMSRRGARQLPLDLVADGNELVARVRAANDQGRPLSGLTGDLQLGWVDGNGRLGAWRGGPRLVERAPGLYEARSPVGYAAAVLAQARLEDTVDRAGAAFLAQGQRWLPLVPDATAAADRLPPGPEGRPLLQAIARETGGQVLSGGGPAQIATEIATEIAKLTAAVPAGQPRPQPLRTPLALLALALFLADVASRRANFRAPGAGTHRDPKTGRGAAW